MRTYSDYTIALCVIVIMFIAVAIINEWDEFKEEMKERGCIWALILLIVKSLKWIFGELIYKRKKEEYGPIFSKWQNEWKQRNSSSDSAYKSEKDLFYKLFCSTYKSTCKSAEKNQIKNFRMKLLTLMPSIILFTTAIVYIGYHLINSFIKSGGLTNPTDLVNALSEIKLSSPVVYGTMVYILLLIVTIVIQQWIDVKQYQETWVRHQHHKFKMETEMYHFIRKSEDYDGLNSISSREKFEENILKIWAENEDRFVENMEREEQGILNKFTSTIGKGKG